MAKFMKGHDEKQRQIFENIPADRRIASRPAVDFKHRHQKPGPMQEDINSREAE